MILFIVLIECSHLPPHDSVDSAQVPPDDGSEVSRDFCAVHLRRLQLYAGDSEVLRTCFSIAVRYSSLEMVEVRCDTPGEHCVVAESPCSACCPFTLVGITYLL